MKRAMFFICGICWLGFGAGFGFFLLQYVTNGAGLQDVGPRRLVLNHAISPESVLAGFVHSSGLLMLSALCFLIGIGLCLHGLFPRPSEGRRRL